MARGQPKGKAAVKAAVKADSKRIKKADSPMDASMTDPFGKGLESFIDDEAEQDDEEEDSDSGGLDEEGEEISAKREDGLDGGEEGDSDDDSDEEEEEPVVAAKSTGKSAKKIPKQIRPTEDDDDDDAGQASEIEAKWERHPFARALAKTRKTLDVRAADNVARFPTEEKDTACYLKATPKSDFFVHGISKVPELVEPRMNAKADRFLQRQQDPNTLISDHNWVIYNPSNEVRDLFNPQQENDYNPDLVSLILPPGGTLHSDYFKVITTSAAALGLIPVKTFASMYGPGYTTRMCPAPHLRPLGRPYVVWSNKLQLFVPAVIEGVYIAMGSIGYETAVSSGKTGRFWTTSKKYDNNSATPTRSMKLLIKPFHDIEAHIGKKIDWSQYVRPSKNSKKPVDFARVTPATYDHLTEEQMRQYWDYHSILRSSFKKGSHTMITFDHDGRFWSDRKVAELRGEDEEPADRNELPIFVYGVQNCAPKSDALGWFQKFNKSVAAKVFKTEASLPVGGKTKTGDWNYHGTEQPAAVINVELEGPTAPANPVEKTTKKVSEESDEDEPRRPSKTVRKSTGGKAPRKSSVKATEATTEVSPHAAVQIPSLDVEDLDASAVFIVESVRAVYNNALRTLQHLSALEASDTLTLLKKHIYYWAMQMAAQVAAAPVPDQPTEQLARLTGKYDAIVRNLQAKPCTVFQQTVEVFTSDTDPESTTILFQSLSARLMSKTDREELAEQAVAKFGTGKSAIRAIKTFLPPGWQIPPSLQAAVNPQPADSTAAKRSADEANLSAYDRLEEDDAQALLEMTTHRLKALEKGEAGNEEDSPELLQLKLKKLQLRGRLDSLRSVETPSAVIKTEKADSPAPKKQKKQRTK